MQEICKGLDLVSASCALFFFGCDWICDSETLRAPFRGDVKDNEYDIVNVVRMNAGRAQMVYIGLISSERVHPLQPIIAFLVYISGPRLPPSFGIDPWSKPVP